MKSLQRHLSRCMIAGVVAILPIAGLAFSVVYLEKQLAGSWLKDQGFYFYGEGLILGVVLIYLIGLVISTFLGRWIWSLFDKVLGKLPLLGRLYQTLKQVLGYGEGPDAVGAGDRPCEVQYVQTIEGGATLTVARRRRGRSAR